MKQELLNHDNKYRAVFGAMPKKYELSNWSSNTFEHFFNFCDIFYEGGKIKVSNEKCLALENLYDEQGNDFKYAEFLNRIGKPYDPQDERYAQKFYLRLATFMRVVIAYCKKHPLRLL